MSSIVEDKDPDITIKDLPIKFTVKYLGCLPAKGLWGMKHTRKPVDALVAAAKNLPPGTIPPLVKLEVNINGLKFKELDPNGKETSEEKVFPVENISYGVQDLVYTRVFSMIHVIDDNLQNGIPFYCHSFVCESRHQARQITFALAAAFQEYGRKVKENKVKKFAIDLRTPEEQARAQEEDDETDA